jgi:hypothetical protein
MTSTREGLSRARLAARIQELEAKYKAMMEKAERQERELVALSDDSPEAVMGRWQEKLRDQETEYVRQQREAYGEVPGFLTPGRPQPQRQVPAQQKPQISLEDALAQMTPEEYAQHRNELGPGMANPNAYSRRNVNSKVTGDSQFGDMTPHQWAQMVRDIQAGQ